MRVILIDKEILKRASELRREYYKEWRKKNPTKATEYNQNHWIKKARNEMEKGNN